MATETEAMIHDKVKGENKDDEPHVLACIRFIVGSPFAALFLLSLVPITLSAVGMSQFTLENLDGWDVRDSLSSRNFDAYLEALEAYDDPVSRRRLQADDPQTVPVQDVFFHVYYTGSSLFDFAALEAIERFENQIMASPEMQRSCLKIEVSPGIFECDQPISVTQHFNGSGFNKTEFFAQTVSDGSLGFIRSKDFLVSGFSETSPVRSLRTAFKLGLPRAGFSSGSSQVSAQEKQTEDDIQSIVIRFEDSPGSGVESFYDFTGINSFTAFRTLANDGIFAGGSLVYVGIFLGVHTGSVFMAVTGMLQILVSFPTTYFFYRVVFGIVHFGTLQVLAIFVILGIGADDIFVFFDAYRQSKVILPANTSREVRMQWAYRKAAVAMLLTSITTFAAFMVTALSGIVNIRVFGIFAATLVLVNYLLCISLLPALIIIHEQYVKPYRFCMCWCCCTPWLCSCCGDNKCFEKAQEPASDEDVNDTSKYQLGRWEKVYRDRFSPIIIEHKLKLITAVLTLTGVIAGLGISLIGPSDKVIEDIYADDHPLTILKNLKLDEFGFGTSGHPLVDIVFGVNPFDRSTAAPFDPRIKGTFSFDDQFNFTAQAQLELQSLCTQLRTTTFVLDPGEVDCFIEHWATFLSQSIPLDPATLPAFLAAQPGFADRVFIHPTTEEVVFIVITARLSQRVDAPIDDRLSAIRGMDSFVKNFPTTDLSNGFVTYFFFPWWETQEHLVQTSQIGLGSGIALAFAVILLATRSFRVAALSTFSIGCIVGCVLGTMGLIGWDLGFMEAVSIVCLVGLSVDYVVHLCVAYVEFQEGDLSIIPEDHKGISLENNLNSYGVSKRAARTTVAYTRLGVSVLAGAITTFGAAMFLLLCTIQYLGQFGAFLAMVIGFSLVVSHLLLGPLLALLGPEGWECIPPPKTALL